MAYEALGDRVNGADKEAAHVLRKLLQVRLHGLFVLFGVLPLNVDDQLVGELRSHLDAWAAGE